MNDNKLDLAELAKAARAEEIHELQKNTGEDTVSETSSEVYDAAKGETPLTETISQDNNESEDMSGNVLSTNNTIDDIPIITSSKKRSLKMGVKKPGDEDINEANSSINATLNSDEEMRSRLSDLDDVAYESAKNSMKNEILEYRKNLIIEYGFTPEEADNAALNRLNNRSEMINNEYLETHPQLGVITIDKDNIGDLGLTDEEHEKLTTTRNIELVLKEKKELQSIKIKKVNPTIKTSYVKTLEGAISRFSVPLPILGDYITFKGAQSLDLVAAIDVDSERKKPVEALRKQASFIYDKMIGGVVYKKYDNDGNISMSYDEFYNTFKYADSNLALYGILCASSPEKMDAPVTCARCSKEYMSTFRIRSVLDFDPIPDSYKNKIDSIDRNKADVNLIQKYVDESDEVLRLESTGSGNIYDISHPTLAKADSIFSSIEDAEDDRVIRALLSLYIDNIYIYDESDESYIEFNSISETESFLEVFSEIPEEDFNLLYLKLQEFAFNPSFAIKTKCAHCGFESSINVNINDLVFLKTREWGEATKL